MDWSSLIGLLVAFSSVILGHLIEGGSFYSLLQPTAFIIVVLGTFGAVLLQSGWVDIKLALTLAAQTFQKNEISLSELSSKIHQWRAIARSGNPFALEDQAKNESEVFIQKGLRLVSDALPTELIASVIKNDIYLYESRQYRAIKVWESAGGYAPTLGILGAVVGLVHVMENLSDPAKIGGGIAVAFVATIYGVALANLLLIPVANKLKSVTHMEINKREMLMDGLISISKEEMGFVLEERLNAYLEQE